MTATFSQAKTETYLKLGQKGATGNFSENVVGDMINQLHRQICEGTVVDIRDPRKIYRAGRLNFMENQKVFQVSKTISLTTQFDAGDTLAYMPTADLASAGFLLCEYEIGKYLSKTADHVVDISGWTVDHKSGALIMELYAMPVDFGKPIFVRKASSGREIKYNYQEQYSINPYYTIETYSDGTKLLKPMVDETGAYVVKYMKKITSMVLDTDTTNLPNIDVDKDVLSTLAAGILAYEKGMPVGVQLLSKGYANLQRFYSNQASDEYQINKTVKVIPFRMGR